MLVRVLFGLNIKLQIAEGARRLLRWKHTLETENKPTSGGFRGDNKVNIRANKGTNQTNPLHVMAKFSIKPQPIKI